MWIDLNESPQKLLFDDSEEIILEMEKYNFHMLQNYNLQK